MTVSASSVRPGWSRPAGLRVETEAHGALRTLALGDIVVNLFVANALEGGPANLALRRHSDAVAATLLLGPRSPTRWRADPRAGRLDGIGDWDGLRYRIGLRLAADAPAWFWHLRVENTGREAVRIDAMAWQDLALTTDSALRLNEYYVSQYIDHTPLAHPQCGDVLAARQNQPVGGRHPWCIVGSLARSVAYATDALQVFGRAARAGAPPPCLAQGLPSRRLQHEHAMAALQDAPRELAPGEAVDLGWFGRVVADHPGATSQADLALVDETLALPEARSPVWGDLAEAEPAAPSLFAASPLLASLPLDDTMLDARFGTARRHVERDAEGRVLSFFHATDAHVVLRDKELAVLRPHGQILRTGAHREPDESALTSTVWMGGVFHSMLTQGHVSINRCLSTVRSYLGLFRSHGLRVFIEGEEGGWQLLDQPSAFEMRPDACTWIYRHAGGEIEVTSRARSGPHALGLEIRFVAGPAPRCLVVLHVALDGDDGRSPGQPHAHLAGGAVVLAPRPGSALAQRFPQGHLRIEPGAGTTIEHLGGDELLFPDGATRDTACLALRIAAAPHVHLTLRGGFITEGCDVPAATGPDPARIGALHEIRVPAASPHAERLAAIADLMPWLEQNALVHYLSPRGLEQFSGGGWGTRDVSQGPVELLLAQGRHEAVRALLLRVMKAQQPDGDWPQWFMFFERDAAIRAGDSHGDVVFWPLLALGQYLIASGDATLLDERVPFYRARGRSASTGAPSVWTHVLRALALIRRRVIAGTALPAYGHGDWNDALQPADPALREKLCSAWTATLHHQTLTTLARGLRGIGRGRTATRLEREAQGVRRDFARLLIADGVLAGYARFEGQGQAQRVDLLLHPRDETTGVRYSLLAMIHAILEGLFDPAQVRDHLRLIAEHLSGPDGARLFDKPLPYRGGPQRLFQRAESASYFGREIGLMYMHAHLRYAQALAHAGEAVRFFDALALANPIGLRDLVPSAGLRSSNTYTSSSDAAFADRYEASAEYGRVRAGTVALEAGWRVYSSGAGILYGLVVRHLFGLRLEALSLVIDPVMPTGLDGTSLHVTLLQRELQITYRVAAPGCGVVALELDGQALGFEEESQPYRRGGARVPLAVLQRDAAQAGSPPQRLLVRVGA